MPSIFASPALRYGISAMSAALVVAVTVLFFEGPARWIGFGIAALELLVTPQILKQAN